MWWEDVSECREILRGLSPCCNYKRTVSYQVSSIRDKDQWLERPRFILEKKLTGLGWWLCKVMPWDHLLSKTVVSTKYLQWNCNTERSQYTLLAGVGSAHLMILSSQKCTTVFQSAFWLTPETNNLSGEKLYLAHSFRSFGPWSTGLVVLGPVVKAGVHSRGNLVSAGKQREREERATVPISPSRAPPAMS